jgi:hypothetical protein
MSLPEDLPLSKMEEPGIIPGSITIVQPGYVPTGSIVISSTLDFYVGASRQKDFSWRVGGLIEKEISSQWNTGEGEYYWYRVEGECGNIDCENSGIDASQCGKMTFVTVVSARNVPEVCDALNAPRLNPPVNLRIVAIKKYSRPVLKGSVPDEQCNVPDEQEFCHIPECLDYCVDETAVVPAVMSMSVIDFLESREMSGGFSLGGSSETNRNRRYDPEFPIIPVSGAASCILAILPESTMSFVLSGSSSKTISNIVVGCQGSALISGSSRATSPSYYFSATGALSFSGSSISTYPSFEFNQMQFEAYLELELESGGSLLSENGEPLHIGPGAFSFSGSAESALSARFFISGPIRIEGMSGDYISPSRFYRPSGGFALGGQAERNFEGLGTIVVESSFDMTSTDFASDFNDLSYSSALTISDPTVTTPCGCGPLGLSLVARHNLSGSSAINNFLNKNNESLPSYIAMKYRSSDTSWRSNLYFAGSNESLSILFSLACMDDVWRLDFSAIKSTYGVRKHTKFIVDMPSDTVCSDGNISTRISLGAGSSVVAGIPVVSPAHISSGTALRSSAVVDGVVFDYLVYYDEIGIFKDAHWSRMPFEIVIQPLNQPAMPSVDLERIFP